ncbi:MAG: TRAP transporter small permease [Acetobacteraceae bacterium]|nr:TRAP transporter small permease [Acetobacteraceae bacterium]MDW8398291.1 TRAP transporter small permease [Acetobacteraceae bacterium]
MDGRDEGGTIGWIIRLTAFAGGVALLLGAALTTVSVLLRWTLRQPIPGDFELVAILSGLAVFGFLGWGTLRRSNILVDSLTAFLPKRVNEAIDAFWMVVWAGTAVLLAERMAVGAVETFRNGTATMVLLLPTWWAVALGALGLAIVVPAALLWAWRLGRGRRG